MYHKGKYGTMHLKKNSYQSYESVSKRLRVMKKSEQLLHYNNANINEEMKYFNFVGDEGDNTVIEKCDITSTFHTSLQTIEPGLSFRFQNLTACGEKIIRPLAIQ